MVKTLVDITNHIKRCESLLKKRENNSSQQLEDQGQDDSNILDEKFPMKNMDDVKNIEQQLRHNEIFKKQVVSIKMKLSNICYYKCRHSKTLIFKLCNISVVTKFILVFEN